MSGIQNFRTALNGFNRQDVVSYIEYMNNKHNSQIEQLNNQLQAAHASSADPQLQAQLEAAQARIRELETQLAQAVPATTTVNCTEQELEAYRRAERAERVAQERAQQIYHKANAVLADTLAQMEAANEQAKAAESQLSAQLDQFKASILGTGAYLRDAVASLGQIAPDND